MVYRRILLGTILCCSAYVAGCAPSTREAARPAAGALAERACLEAAAAETSAARKLAAYRSAQTDFSTQQVRLVDLQRIRSRIATGRMTDEELAAWEQEPARMEPAAAQAPTAEPAPALAPTEAASPDTTAVEQAPPVTDSGATTTPVEMQSPAEEQTTPAGENEPAPAPATDAAPADTTGTGGESTGE